MRRLVLVVVLVAGCKTVAPVVVEPAAAGAEEEGMASFYAARLAGQKTANGSSYDPALFTAAHRTRPFDSCVRVVRVDDGRSVEVRITDRGPFVAGRIIDLSRAAAEALGFVAEGVVRVRLQAC